MAGSTPDLTLDQEAYRRAMERQGQFFDRALDDSVLKEGNAMIRSGNAAVTGSEIQDRMNPYLDMVLGRTREDMNEQNRIAAAGRAASRGGMRGFGSRGALGEAVARDQEEERLATTMAQQRFQGFETGRDQVNTERARNITAGQTLGSLDINNRSMFASAGGNLMSAANQMMDTGQRERSIANTFENDALEREKQRIGILSGMGGLQQTQMQGSIDASQGLYNSIQQYPYAQLGFGNQMLPNATGSTQVGDTGRNIFGQLLGTGLSIAGLGLPGGGTIGGKLAFGADGGRVGALRMANGGAVPPGMSDMGGNPAFFPKNPMFEGTSTDQLLEYRRELLSRDPSDPLADDIRKELLRREASYATPIPSVARGAPGTAMEYPEPPQRPTGPPPPMPVAAPMVRPGPGTAAPAAVAAPMVRPGPGTAAPAAVAAPIQPQGGLSRAAAATTVTPGTAKAKEEPGIFRQLLEGALEVDPYTGRSMLFDVGLNMIEASSSPTPGRGLLGNLATSIKGAHAGQEAARDKAAVLTTDRKTAEAAYIKAMADLKEKPLSTIGKMEEDRRVLVAKHGPDSPEVTRFDQQANAAAAGNGFSLRINPDDGSIELKQGGASAGGNPLETLYGPGVQMNPETRRAEWMVGTLPYMQSKNAVQSLKDKDADLNRTVKRAADIIRNNPNVAAGIWSEPLSALSQDARDVKGLLEQVAASLAFAELRALRESGATLGQVTEREITLLTALGGTIQQDLSADILLESLDRVLELSAQAVYKADTYFNDLMPKQAAGGSGTPLPQPTGKR
jgi:hypothetical protein